ncbi:MAG TPA: hypothetical protein VFR07_10545 [Mycobacteriales bacterium]|nr:hypothetical protein [Mycobacteriales bacterium]
MTTLPVHAALQRSGAGAEPSVRGGRRLAAYLLVPRPKDLVKAVVVPLTFAVGVAADGRTSAGELLRAVLVWGVLELLVYQARYQWNDIRGFAADQAHPDAASRGRLPGPVERGRAHIAASLTVLGLRLGLTAAVAVLVPDLAGVLVLMTIGVFGVALVYERLRSAATGRAEQVPVPLRPALIGVWVVVGAGYAVRGLTGLGLAVELDGRPALVVASACAMWALGVVFVTCRWTLEAMPFGAVRRGRMVWQVRSGQAREHTLGLVRWLPSDASGAGSDPCTWRGLQGATPLHAPWHLALVVAAASAALAGRLLVGAQALPAGALTVAAGAAVALVVAAAPGRRLGTGTALSLALVALQAALGTPRPLVAVLPVVVVLTAYGCFTRQCADEVGKPLRRLRQSRRR